MEEIYDVVIDGNSVRYIKLSGSDKLYGIEVKNDVSSLYIKTGMNIEIKGTGDEGKKSIDINEFTIK